MDTCIHFQLSLENDVVPLKNKISLKWQDSLKQRRKSHWNYIKNENKASLYEEFLKQSPEYLPLKFRPKRIPNESESATNARIQQAQQSFKASIVVLKTYASDHLKKRDEVDKHIMELLASNADNIDEKSTLIEWWNNDTTKEEAISAQMWERDAAFMKKKKQEDIEQGTERMTTKLWSDILKERASKTDSKRSTKNFHATGNNNKYKSRQQTNSRKENNTGNVTENRRIDNYQKPRNPRAFTNREKSGYNQNSKDGTNSNQEPDPRLVTNRDKQGYEHHFEDAVDYTTARPATNNYPIQEPQHSNTNNYTPMPPITGTPIQNFGYVQTHPQFSRNNIFPNSAPSIIYSQQGFAQQPTFLSQMMPMTRPP